MNVIGNRKANCGGKTCEAATLSRARVVADSNTGSVQRIPLNNSIEVKWARVPDAADQYAYSAVAFVATDLAQNDASGRIKNGTFNADIVPVIETNINQQEGAVADVIGSGRFRNATVINPPAGIQICLQSNDAKKHAVITIGGERSTTVTNAAFKQGDC
jgi:hypothetical protein